MKRIPLLICLLCSLLAVVSPQNPVDENSATFKGVQQYDRGENEAAIITLRAALKEDSNISIAWHYLGLALHKKGELTEARNAFQKAVELQARFFDDMLKSETKDWRDDQLLKARISVSQQIQSQINLLQVLTDENEQGRAQLELEKLNIQAECMQQLSKPVDGHQVLEKSVVQIQRPRILSKVEPEFPAAERKGNVDAEVVLRGMFAPDGTLKYLEVLKSSGAAFTREAMKAALKTTFEPATVCGKPVGFSNQLEYSFMSIH